MPLTEMVNQKEDVAWEGVCGRRWRRVGVKSSVLDTLGQRVNEQKVKK